MYCDFRRTAPAGTWTCVHCRDTARATYTEPPIAWCKASNEPMPALGDDPDGQLLRVSWDCTPCPLAPILHAAPATTNPTAYVSRLHRCLAADCKLIHRVDSRIVCVGRGHRCQWLGEWARFLAGEDECPHWGESTTASPTPPATPQPPP